MNNRIVQVVSPKHDTLSVSVSEQPENDVPAELSVLWEDKDQQVGGVGSQPINPETATSTVIPVDDASVDANEEVDTQCRTEIVQSTSESEDLELLIEEAESLTGQPVKSASELRDEHFAERMQLHRELTGNETDVALRHGQLHYEDWQHIREHPVVGEDDKMREKYWTHNVEKCGIAVRTAILQRTVFDFFTHKQPVARQYLCEVGMTKLSLAVTLHNAGAEKCASKGLKALTFSPDNITITLVQKDSEGGETESVYDFADPALTVRMLRDRMPESGKTEAKDPESLEGKIRQLKTENRDLKKKVQQLQGENLSLQQRALTAETNLDRVCGELEALREQLAELQDMTLVEA